MAPFSLEALDFPALLRLVAEHACSTMGAEDVLLTMPVGSRAEAEERCRPVAEMLPLLAGGQTPPLAGIPDVRPLWRRLDGSGGLTEPLEWRDVRRFLDACSGTRRFFQERARDCPVCARAALDIDEAAGLRAAIHSVLDDEGEIRDSASTELARIRRSLRQTIGRMRGRMSSLSQELMQAGVLQGDYWTLRNGRNALPVKANFKGRVPGLVHGVSDSGETLFIEPYSIVELANETAQLIESEAEEVRRILLELSGKARPCLEPLRRNTEILVYLDACVARARYGQRHGMSPPSFGNGERIAIRAARHPLLMAAGIGPVAVDLEYKPRQRVLVLTGPNAGGKTTALKTLGLLCLMAQSGIPVPARYDSEFPVFTSVHADIGDQQSLSEGLSTFSGHLRRVREILQSAGEGSLVLLDELGTATDPVQGAALAEAILERLAANGARVLATSHLPQLKYWAHEHPAGRNAATGFDEEEGRPSFSIVYDMPGASEAFRVARRLGFPCDVLDEAERRVSSEEKAVHSLIASMEEKRNRMEEELARAEALRGEAEKELQALREREAQLREAERKHKQESLAERRKILEEARARVEQKIANLSGSAALEGARRDLQGEQSALAGEARALEAAAPEIMAFEEIEAGMEVWLPALREKGRILRMNPARRLVVADVLGTEFELPAEQVARLAEGRKSTTEPAWMRRPAPSVNRADPSLASRDLNLHGMRVEAALEELDRFLDRAVLDRLDSVRLLVGRGVMRQAVEEALHRSSLIASFSRGEAGEGGDAALVARIGEKKRGG